MWSSILARAAAPATAAEGGSGTAAIARQVRGYARRRGGGGGKGDAPPPTATAAAETPKPSPAAEAPKPPPMHDRPPTVAANAIAAAAAARARAAEAAAAAAAGASFPSASSPSSSFDAARASAAPRVNQLIGDPRTGVADDTTQRSPAAAASNDVAVELIWTQENPGGIEWFRYTPFFRQQPHMRRDARLSDHSRNLMYLLRCADPAFWTVEALARKFRVRRQRVLAVLALKEMEAQALEDGRLMGRRVGGGSGDGNGADADPALVGGPTSTDNAPLSLARGLRAYRMTVDLADVRLHARSRDPYDLADAAAADGVVAGGGGGGGKGAGGNKSNKKQEVEWVWARPGCRQGGGKNVSLGADPSADLSRVAPAQAVTAQRLHSALLSLLQQHGFSADRLIQGLLSQVDAAEAHYEAHVRGTPLERALELGWRAAEAEREAERLGAVAAAVARREAADPWAVFKAVGSGGDSPSSEEASDGAAEGDAKQEEGGEGDSTPSSSSPLFDFASQRAALRSAVDALRPLLANAGPRAEREAAALATELSALLGRADEGGEGKEGEADGGEKDGALRAAAAAASPATLARAFNALPRDQRQALLDRAPAARAALDLRGADLTAVVNPFVSEGGGASSYAALSLSSSSSAAAASSSSGGSTTTTSYALGRWPGQVRPLVDVWGYEEVGAQGGASGALPGAGPPADPDALFAALLGGEGAADGGSGEGGALLALERAVADLDRCAAALGIQGGVTSSSTSSSPSQEDALGSLDDFLAGGQEGQQKQKTKPAAAGKGGGGAGTGVPLPTCADVLALREDLHTYQHIDWLYDRAVDHQAAELVAAAAAERAVATLASTSSGGSGQGGSAPANTAAAAARLLAAPPRRVSETPGAWDTPPLPAKQQQRMLRLLRALDPSAAERLMYLEALSREDRAAGAALALGGAAAEGALRRAARMREQVTRVLRHMDAQVNGAEAGAGEEEEGGEEAKEAKEAGDATTATATATANAIALPPRPSDLPDTAPSSRRAPLELVAAFIESTIVGRQFHRGSGERHVALIPTYPSFDGRPLSEASGEGAESELSAVAREAAKREDDAMWRDFRARLLHNLGVSGTDLWDVRGRARPQRPAEGWSMVVHPVGSKVAEEKGGEAGAIEPRAGLGAPPAGAGRHAAAAPYVSEPGGALRPLRGDEAILEKRRTPKRRRRWPL